MSKYKKSLMTLGMFICALCFIQDVNTFIGVVCISIGTTIYFKED